MRHHFRIGAVIALVLGLADPTRAVDPPPTPREFAPPPLTAWRPEGCRTVPTNDPVLGSRDRWRMLHSDAVNSDEVSIALAPVFEPDWRAEPNTFNVAVPTFDAAGNLYFAPFLPHENVIMISLDPTDGSRRWAIPGTGAPVGAVSPMVLNDPDNPGEEIVYLTLRDRAVAVRTDGTIVWDVPTGLTLTGVLRQDSMPGMNYLPQLDAIVGLTGDGHLYALSRATGAQLLATPYSLPGEPSPAGGIALPPVLVENVADQLAPLINFPPGSSLQSFLAAILGNEIEVSNSFSIDPWTGRLWVAATAPDAVDGTVDGVSEFGALYGLDVVPNGSSHEVVIGCSRYFEGGSASTPDLTADGTRIYVGDNFGALLAIDPSCNDAWTLDIGSQIVGSVGTSSDNGEIYVATQTSIVQVVDDGASAHVGWTADLDVYVPGADNQQNFNLLLASVGANGVGFMSGVGVPPGVLAGIGFPYRVGYGVLDRATGSVRYFADALDESVAELNVGPDGAYYNGNSPIRRAFTRALLPGFTPPIEGGIVKYDPRRNDLLIRDGVCAARDRAANALAFAGTCPDSAAADATQIADLIAQARRAAPRAVADGDLWSAKWDRVDALLTQASGSLASAAAPLASACAVLEPCPSGPLNACRTAARSRLRLKQRFGREPNADVLRWTWRAGQETGAGEFADPTVGADYGVCIYAGAAGTESLLYEAGLPASASLWTPRPRGFAYLDRDRVERGMSRVSLKGGAPMRAMLDVRANGAALGENLFPIATPIRAQIVNFANGTCWESRFESTDVLRNGSGELRVKTSS
jgi:outer membrane protein assembly factor BamB